LFRAFGTGKPAAGTRLHVAEELLPRICRYHTALHRCRLAVGLLLQFLALDLGVGGNESGSFTELLLRCSGGNLLGRAAEASALKLAGLAIHAPALGAERAGGRTQR
jgi:hypothetical protein